MSYVSFGFGCFVLLSVALYYLLPLRRRYWVLLAASAAFYLLNSGWAVLALGFSTLTVYLAALYIEKNHSAFETQKTGLEKAARKALKAVFKKKNQRILAITVTVNVLLLVVFKYMAFLVGNVNSLLALFGAKSLPVLQWAAPLGISYYTLMAISYLTDVCRGQVTAERNYGKVFLFLSFFPYLLEGPIGRYNDLSGQLLDGNRFEYENFQQGLWLVLWGLFKKLVVADKLALYVNEVFANFSEYSGLLVALAILGYVIQIYADFSGSIEIVTGVARLYGIRLAVNFEQPFFSKSVQEFWRRWHITLGAWLRDYVYYPISLMKWVTGLGNRCRSNYLKGVVPALIANFAVWTVMGLWHGASWKYVLYGIYYFILVAIAILSKPRMDQFHAKSRLEGTRVLSLFQMLRTFLLVTVGMLIFRAETLGIAVRMLGKACELRPVGFTSLYEQLQSVFATAGYDYMGRREFVRLFAAPGLIFVVDILAYRGRLNRLCDKFFHWPFMARIFIEIAVAMLILCYGVYGPSFSNGAFIYGGF